MNTLYSMKVQKRDGSLEEVSFDKVLHRIQICAGQRPSHSIQFTPLEVNPTLIAQRALASIYDGVKTSELDELAAQLAISLVTTHPDYGTLASRIIVSNHQANTCPSFVTTMKTISSQINPKSGLAMTYLAESYMAAVDTFGSELDNALNQDRDYLLDYFGFKTLERQKYLLRGIDGKVLERPQHMWMRVAVGLWGAYKVVSDAERLALILETYELLSLKQFIHATPTMFNAGSPRAQLSSCYLIALSEDSIDGIYKTLADCAKISKYAGGIGLHIHNLRAKGSYINGNGGTSTGIVPMLKNFNATARYVDQGSKRNGSFAIYLEPWHADVEDFLKLKLNSGSEDERARDLFYALWIPDLFMERVEADKPWTLFCPSESPGLADVHGDAFKALYERYEAEGRGRRQVDARQLFDRIVLSQIETGTPYMLYKDAANAKSNQQNLGTIKSSNLCVAGETMVLTKAGDMPIATLEELDINVWNGYKWSKTRVHKTGEQQPVLKVTIKNLAVNTKTGTIITSHKNIDCTPYHKFILQGDEEILDARRVEAKDLKEGTELMSWIDPRGISHMMTVSHIENSGRLTDTYCFNEPEQHSGVFNGILTGNCTEIIEYSNSEETAVCNLASIALPAFVKGKTFDFDGLRKVVKVAVRNLNRVIDINFYPTPETERSNKRHRPIGLGIQGLADIFAMMRLPWETATAQTLHKRIFEHMYFAALEASAEIAAKEGPYSSFEGSPTSKGILQFDMWLDPTGTPVTPLTQTDGTLDWLALKERVKRGIRNSLLMAPMPTASTSQILGYNECFEPVTSNIYTRRTLSGEYIVLNKYLVRDLLKLGLWNEGLKNQIIARNGSIQSIEDIPQATKNLYKTAWEIKQRVLIDMAADRGAFICQSQSLNLFLDTPTKDKIVSMHFYGWKKGLKTGQYYLRTKAPVMAQKFTIDPELQKEAEKSEALRQQKEGEADEGCLNCSA
uniref:ribonucleoside-diphosphate reductase n=1 Tax=viral metagenome TaxID=1070528 RepID=A0A6C0APS5_9ZZZZ